MERRSHAIVRVVLCSIAHPSLRHRRDRQRQLSLQEPRPTPKTPNLTEPRSPRLRNPIQLRQGKYSRHDPSPTRGAYFTPIPGAVSAPIDNIEAAVPDWSLAPGDSRPASAARNGFDRRGDIDLRTRRYHPLRRSLPAYGLSQSVDQPSFHDRASALLSRDPIP